jgi:hypothetical protein
MRHITIRNFLHRRTSSGSSSGGRPTLCVGGGGGAGTIWRMPRAAAELALTETASTSLNGVVTAACARRTWEVE